MRNTLLVLTISFVLGGCVTPLHEALEEVDVGMDKTQVIDKIGGPNKSTRINSVDHWTYIYTVNGEEKATLVKIKDGSVIDIQPTTLGPKAMDAIKDADTMEEYKAGVKKKKETKKGKFKDID